MRKSHENKQRHLMLDFALVCAEFTSTSFCMHFDFTMMPLRYHGDVALVLRRLDFGFTSAQLRIQAISTSTSPMTLWFHFGVSLNSLWLKLWFRFGSLRPHFSVNPAWLRLILGITEIWLGFRFSFALAWPWVHIEFGTLGSQRQGFGNIAFPCFLGTNHGIHTHLFWNPRFPHNAFGNQLKTFTHKFVLNILSPKYKATNNTSRKQT